MTSPGGALQRRLGLASAVAITFGGVVGSGIFLTPLGVAQALPSVEWLLGLWLALGVLCLCGACAYAELAAMLPAAGGQYAFLRAAWGELPAFLFGWVFFWIVTPGSIAALAVAFSKALLQWAAADGSAFELPLAVAMIVALALVNIAGVAFGALLQNVATIAKLAALLLLVGAALLTPAVAAPVVAAAGAAPPLTALALGTACLGVFWAYEGWYELPFNAAELKRPERDLPRGLLLGLSLVVLLYLAVLFAYLRLVPFEELRALPADGGQALPALAFARAFGQGGERWLLLLIAVSVLGSANPGLLSSPRAFYAMAQDGLLPRALVAVHPRRGTPTVAIAVQAVVASVEVLALRTFGDLTAFVVFASFVFYALTVAAVFRLRARCPELPRPYRCTGYPFAPALFVVAALAFLAVLLAEPSTRADAGHGLWILGSGVPAWWWAVRRRGVRAD